MTKKGKKGKAVHLRRAAPLRATENPLSKSKHVAIWIYAGLVLLALLPYLQTLGYDFVNFDDVIYVAENPRVQRGLSWDNIAWAWTALAAGHWHPLTWLSHMLDCQLFGLLPGWHHLVNLLLHSANAALVFLVFRTMTGMTWQSALVAALFAVHPLHVESVAWIAERKDVLSTFFGLLAIWAYAGYVRAPSGGRYTWVACFFALSLLSKPMLVTLPFVLLLLDVWPFKRLRIESGTPNLPRPGTATSIRKPSLTSLLLEKIPLLLMSGVSSVLTFKAQHAGGAVAPIDYLPLSQRLAIAVVGYVTYLGKMFWPANLAVVYPLPDQIAPGKVVFALLLLAGITAAVVILMRNRPWLGVGWLWFVGMLVPVIGLVQVGNQSMADRFTYMPLIGIFVMISWSLPSAAFRGFNSGAVALVLLVLSVATFIQVQVWKNTGTLFDHAVKVTEGNFLAHNLLAGVLGEQGDLAGARAHIEKSLQIRPSYTGARFNLGSVMVRAGDFAGAREQFQQVLLTSPENSMAWHGLGVANVSLGRIDEAISNYRHALELNPNYANAFTNLGRALLTQGKYTEAIEMCQAALRLNPNIADAHVSLGTALWNLGRTDESILHDQMALKLDPHLIPPRINLSTALLAKEKYEEAIAQLEYLVRLDPQNEAAQKLLFTARQKRDGKP